MNKKKNKKENVIKVSFFATLRLALGVDSVNIKIKEPITVKELLDIVSNKIGISIKDKLLEKNGSIKRGTIILINGKNIIHLQGVDTKISSGEVAIFPPAGGG